LLKEVTRKASIEVLRPRCSQRIGFALFEKITTPLAALAKANRRR
jgi:hypothetical protein